MNYAVKMTGQISRLVDSFCKAMSVVFITLFIGTILGGVLLRFVFKVPNSAMEDLSRTGFVWACFWGMAHTYKRKAFVKFTFFTKRLSSKGERVFSLIAEILSIALFLFLVIYGIRYTRQTWPTWQVGAGISKGWMSLAIPTGSLMSLVHAIHFATNDLSMIIGKEEK